MGDPLFLAAKFTDRKSQITPLRRHSKNVLVGGFDYGVSLSVNFGVADNFRDHAPVGDIGHDGCRPHIPRLTVPGVA